MRKYKILQTRIKEVVLTGIHLASHGKDFTDEKSKEYIENNIIIVKNTRNIHQNDDLASGGLGLIELLEQINKVDGIGKN